MAEHHFHTPEPVELDIQIPVGDIRVDTVDGEESYVSVTGSEKLVEHTRVSLDGNKLSIVRKAGTKPFGITISIGDFSFGSGGLQVHAKVPHGSEASLMTAAADMKLRGRYASLSTKSASGDLTLTGEVEHDANVKTVSGDVRVDQVGGELKVQSVSGDVAVASVGGSIETRSVSGDVRFESVREGVLTVQSVSGDIEIGVARGTNLEVDAGSVSGELSSEVPLGSVPGESEDDGPRLVVHGKTVSGDFRVFRAV
jgi:Putative adhesin